MEGRDPQSHSRPTSTWWGGIHNAKADPHPHGGQRATSPWRAESHIPMEGREPHPHGGQRATSPWRAESHIPMEGREPHPHVGEGPTSLRHTHTPKADPHPQGGISPHQCIGQT
ncbi:unnamed protein product, partial [Arctogadus glacialis]